MEFLPPSSPSVDKPVHQALLSGRYSMRTFLQILLEGTCGGPAAQRLVSGALSSRNQSGVSDGGASRQSGASAASSQPSSPPPTGGALPLSQRLQVALYLQGLAFRNSALRSKEVFRTAVLDPLLAMSEGGVDLVGANLAAQQATRGQSLWEITQRFASKQNLRGELRQQKLLERLEFQESFVEQHAVMRFFTVQEVAELNKGRVGADLLELDEATGLLR